MPLNIQNLEARARQIGKSVEDFSQDFGNNISSQLQQSANVFTDGLRSSVEGSINQLEGAVKNLVDPFQQLFKFGRGSRVGGSSSNQSGGSGDLISTKPTYSGGPIPNALSQYSSVNAIFTLGVLTDQEVNFPDSTYRKNGPSIVVLRSGGSGNKQARTEIEKSLGITTEYYIDDVEIESIIAPSQRTKQTNATNLNFTVHEPYSMGQFLQTLEEAALLGRHRNYLDAPFMLSLEFIGWDSNGNVLRVPNTSRYFPLKFSNITFNVDQGGSVYTVEAIPWNEQALSDEVQTTKEDFDLKGETLVEMLQTGPESLASLLNNREVELENSKNKGKGDQYVILFPNSRSSASEGATGTAPEEGGATTQSGGDQAGDTRTLSDAQKQKVFEQISGIQAGDVPKDFDAELSKLLGLVVRRSKLGESIREYAEKSENTNPIGGSFIAKSYLDGGKQAFGKPAFTQDENNPGVFKRGNITIQDKGRRINFKKGTRVQEIIEELILLSDYGRKFASDDPDETGNKKWFKIDTNVYNVSDSDNVAQTGEKAKVYVYRVIPYDVNTSRLNAPNQPTKGITNLQRRAMKEYNYIYTGKNDDIINFDIQVNYAFFSAIQSDHGQLTQSQVEGNQNKIAAGPTHPIYGKDPGRNDVYVNGGTSKTKTTTGTQTGSSGGGVEQHPETSVARNFNDAIVNSNVDLVMAEMDIWGDPYYISDTGMGNYNAPAGASTNITADGTMDYQYGEVDVLVNFRTPIDIGKDGFMEFPQLGTKAVAEFSGLYQVTMVRNKFSGNTFTQMLTMLRRRNQETNTNAPPVSTKTETIVEKGAEGAIAPTQTGTVGTITDAAALNEGLDDL